MYEEKTSANIKKYIEDSISTKIQVTDPDIRKKTFDEVSTVIRNIGRQFSTECEMCANGFCYSCGPKIIETVIDSEKDQEILFFIILEKRICIDFTVNEEEHIRTMIKSHKNAVARKMKYSIEKEITKEILKIIKQRCEDNKQNQRKYNLDCLIRNQIIDTQNYLLLLLISHINQIKRNMSIDTIKSIDHVLRFSERLLKEKFTDISDDMGNLKYIDSIMNARINVSTRNIIKSGISLVSSARAVYIGTKRIYIADSMPGVYWRNGEWHNFENSKIGNEPKGPKYINLEQYDEVTSNMSRLFVCETKKTYEVYDPISQTKQTIDK